MNKRLNEAIARVQALPDDRQSEAAALLFDFLDQEQADVSLTAEQIAEIERRLSWFLGGARRGRRNWVPDAAQAHPECADATHEAARLW